MCWQLRDTILITRPRGVLHIHPWCPGIIGRTPVGHMWAEDLCSLVSSYLKMCVLRSLDGVCACCRISQSLPHSDPESCPTSHTYITCLTPLEACEWQPLADEAEGSLTLPRGSMRPTPSSPRIRRPVFPRQDRKLLLFQNLPGF